MAQRFDFNEKGLGDIQIGLNLLVLKNIKPLEVHPKRSAFSTWFDDEFKYYYVDKDLMATEDSSKIEYFFIIPNRDNEIIGMIIYINDTTEVITKNLEKVFGKPVLGSESSIEGFKTTSKLFWKSSAGITIFLTKYQGLNLSKIDICDLNLNDKKPGVSLRSE